MVPRLTIFVDVGAVFNVVQPLLLTDAQTQSFGSRQVFDAAGDPVLDANGNATFETAPQYLTVNAAGEAVTTFDAMTGGVANPIATSFTERFFGDSINPRLSVGIGVNWNSPFGPFRIDVAKALLKEPGDDTKLFTFNVGTQF